MKMSIIPPTCNEIYSTYDHEMIACKETIRYVLKGHKTLKWETTYNLITGEGITIGTEDLDEFLAELDANFTRAPCPLCNENNRIFRFVRIPMLEEVNP